MKKPIGYISYTHGLDGKVKVVPMVSNEEFIDCLNNDDVFIREIFEKDNNSTDKKENKSYKKIKMSIYAFNGKSFICRISGINNITNAEKILKNEIYVNCDDNFIDAEKIIGFDVFINNILTHEIKKKLYGKIIDCGNYGDGMLIEVKTINNKSEFYKCDNNNIGDVNYNDNYIILIKDI